MNVSSVLGPGDQAIKSDWLTRVLAIKIADHGGSVSDVDGDTKLYMEAREAWAGARSNARNELRKLELAILRAVKGARFADEVAGQLYRLHSVMDVLDERLIEKFDEMLKAGDTSARSALRIEALAIIDGYLGFIDSDPLMLAIDDNPFGAVAVRSTMLGVLTQLRRKIAAAGEGGP